jgi:hypothetical protein
VKSSSENLYQAIMRAADRVELEGQYLFKCVQVTDCRTPMCMIGWIGHFLGYCAGTPIQEVYNKMGYGCDSHFYADLRDCLSGYSSHPDSYTDNPAMAARLMRLYAAKYYGHQKQQQRPTSELVADLMARVTGEHIPDDVHV